MLRPALRHRQSRNLGSTGADKRSAWRSKPCEPGQFPDSGNRLVSLKPGPQPTGGAERLERNDRGWTRPEPSARTPGAVARAHGMELHSAGVAAIGGESEDALQGEQRAFVHVIAGDFFQMDVAALRAMGPHQQAKGYAVRPESRFTRGAAPGEHAHHAQRVLGDVPPARSSASARLAERTNHESHPQDQGFRTRTIQGSRAGTWRKRGNGAAFGAAPPWPGGCKSSCGGCPAPGWAGTAAAGGLPVSLQCRLGAMRNSVD